jgi:hypothetical protein
MMGAGVEEIMVLLFKEIINYSCRVMDMTENSRVASFLLHQLVVKLQRGGSGCVEGEVEEEASEDTVRGGGTEEMLKDSEHCRIRYSRDLY